MGTLRGFPNPPALWLRRAEPGYAYAVMETRKGFPTLGSTETAGGTVGRTPAWRNEVDHFVSLCSVCLRHLLQYFDSLSFSAFARLFFVLE